MKPLELTDFLPRVVPLDKETRKPGDLGNLYGSTALVGSSSQGFPCLPLSDAAIGRLGEKWGIGSDGTFPCPVPGHEGRSRFAVEEGSVRVRCCRGAWRSLGDVRASEGYGLDSRRRTNIEIAIWHRRLAYEFDGFEPDWPELPELTDASKVVEKARAGFALVIGLRRASGDDRPIAYASRFCGAWVGINKDAAALALRQMRAQGVIRHVGWSGRARLYECGTRTPADADRGWR